MEKEYDVVKILHNEDRKIIIRKKENEFCNDYIEQDKEKDVSSLGPDVYRNLVERANDGIAIIQSKKIIFLNQRAASMLGYTIDEVLGTEFPMYIPLKLRNYLIQNYNDRFSGKTPSSIYETLLLKKNGIAIPVEINSCVVNYNGKPADMVIIRDITTRKKAEEKIRENERRFRNLAELLPEIVFEMDSKGILRFVNQQAFRKTGYSIKDFKKGFPALRLLIPEDHERAKQNIRLVMQGKEIKSQDYTARRKNGTEFPIIVYSSPIEKGNKILGIRGIIVDITDLKKSENELKKAQKKLKMTNKELEEKVKERTVQVENLLKQKDYFINQLGHDLKSPLTPVLNLLPLLVNLEDNKKRNEIIGLVLRNMDYIKNLVTKTLELAKISSSKTVFDLKDVCLREEVEKSIKDQQLINIEKEFIIENKIDENIFVKADEFHLDVLLQNLIRNAVKYSPVGSVITLDACGKSDEITIWISDPGIGMNEEQLAHVFDEFYKADESRHDFYSSGLGLSLCRNIVLKHGGRIWAESPGIGKGSTFYFTLTKGIQNGLEGLKITAKNEE